MTKVAKGNPAKREILSRLRALRLVLTARLLPPSTPKAMPVLSGPTAPRLLSIAICKSLKRDINRFETFKKPF